MKKAFAAAVVLSIFVQPFRAAEGGDRSLYRMTHRGITYRTRHTDPHAGGNGAFLQFLLTNGVTLTKEILELIAAAAVKAVDEAEKADGRAEKQRAASSADIESIKTDLAAIKADVEIVKRAFQTSGEQPVVGDQFVPPEAQPPALPQ